MYQPDIYYKSFELRKAKRIGRTTELVTKFLLPENLDSLNISAGTLQVYLNENLCSESATSLLIDDQTFFTDGEYLYVRDDSEDKNKIVKVIFTQGESKTFEEKDKIYFETDYFLDRDKNNINVLSFSKELKTNTEYRSASLENIKLDFANM